LQQEVRLVIRCQSHLTAHTPQRSEAAPGFEFEVPSVPGTSAARTTLIALLFVSLLIGCFGLLPKAQAVSPAPDADYPGGNAAQRLFIQRSLFCCLLDPPDPVLAAPG